MRIILCHRDTIEDEIRDSQGMTLPHFLAWSSKSRPEHLEPYLRKERSGFMARDNQGRSILHFAAQRGNTLILEYLFQLQSGMDARHQDDRGRTLLHYAVESRRIETIDMMISRNADIRATDNNGRTVLHHAAMCGNLAAVKRIIELGGEEDLGSTDGDGRTPLQLAFSRGAMGVTEYLDQRKSSSCTIQHRAEDYPPSQRGRETSAVFKPDPKELDHKSQSIFSRPRLSLTNSSVICLTLFGSLWYCFKLAQLLLSKTA